MSNNTERAMLGRDLSRRAFTRQVLTGAGILSLPHVLRLRAEAALSPGARKRSLILLWQDGGPSHFETFDPKPEAPVEFRGVLAAIYHSLGINFAHTFVNSVGRPVPILPKGEVIRELARG